MASSRHTGTDTWIHKTNLSAPSKAAERVGVERSKYYPLPFFNRLSSWAQKQPQSRLQPPPPPAHKHKRKRSAGEGAMRKAATGKRFMCHFLFRTTNQLRCELCIHKQFAKRACGFGSSLRFQLPCSTPQDNKVSLKW